MKVFYCRNCKEYQYMASGVFYGKLECSAIIQNEKAEPFIEDADMYEHGLKLEKHASFFECNECGKEEVEIIDVDECPQVWHVWGDKRQCRLCKIVQSGEVVFK